MTKTETETVNKIETETKTEIEMEAEIPSDIVESLITKDRVKGRKWQQRLERTNRKRRNSYRRIIE